MILLLIINRMHLCAKIIYKEILGTFQILDKNTNFVSLIITFRHNLSAIPDRLYCSANVYCRYTGIFCIF